MNFLRAKAKHLSLGRAGESAVAEYLYNCGMTIICRNWRCRAGELDIAAFDGEKIIFAEVKTVRRKNKKSSFSALDNLSRRQMKRNLRAACVYMRAFQIVHLPSEFDLFEVEFSGPFISKLVRHRNYLPPLPPKEPVS